MADFFSDGYGNGLIGGALGMIGGAIQYRRQQKLMDRQYQYALGMAQQNQQYAKEMAGINQGYAKEMAGINQQHNKDMFDYTGYQAQVAQMKAAGLNPALMYGSAGAGGSTQGGAGMAGSASAGSGSIGGTPSAPDTGIISGVGMGLQLGLMDAQKRNIDADTAKKEADAKKTAGADTMYTEALTKLANADIDYRNMSIEKVAAEIKTIGDMSVKLMQEARKLASEADYNEQTLKDRVTKASSEAIGSILDNMQKSMNIELTEAQTKAIAENIAIAWYNAGTNRMNATTATDQAANELIKIMGDLDIREKTLLKDWIYQGVHAGVALLEGVTDIVKVKALIKAAAKGLKEVITKSGRENKDGSWTENTIRELFKD
jgi:hypothetical protein